MPLFICPECNNKVSDQAAACPHCGLPMHRMPKTTHRLWLIPLSLIIFVATPWFPAISLIFGLGIIFCCGGVFIPQIKTMSRRLLRIEHGRPWQNIARITMFGAIGLLFLIFSFGSFGAKADRERLVAEQAAKKVEQDQLKIEANGRVAELAKQAEELFETGDMEGAARTIASAKNTQHASNLAPLTEIEIKIANAKFVEIMSEANQAAEDGRIDIAQVKLSEALSVKMVTSVEPAKVLQKQLELSQDPKGIAWILLDISQEEFEALLNGKMPSSLVTGRLGIDRQISAHVQQQLDQITIAREKLKAEEDNRQHIKASAESFVSSGVGSKVPYEMWDVLGVPETLEGTDNRYWVAYLSENDVSFVSEKSSDKVIFAAFGKNEAQQYLADKKSKRKDQIEGLFSVWNGSQPALTKLIKESMNDPSSYEHVETIYWDLDDHLVVRTAFRGKNAFGGLVKNWVKAKVGFNGKVIEVLESGP